MEPELVLVDICLMVQLSSLSQHADASDRVLIRYQKLPELPG